MSAVYFISDVHFGLESREREKQKEERFLSFLDHVAATGIALYIVGDLFDAWIEYRTVIPKGFHRVLTRIEDLVRNRIDVIFLTGNHDFWIRDFFEDELGMKISRDSFDVALSGKRIYLHHGDGLAIRDGGYRFLKRVLRNPFNIWLFSWLHPDLGLKLARSSSKGSRAYTSTKDYGEEDGMLKFAEQKITREGYDYVVMGHRHRPLCREIGSGAYINLGDWISYNTYAELRDGRMELKTWKE